MQPIILKAYSDQHSPRLPETLDAAEPTRAQADDQVEEAITILMNHVSQKRSAGLTQSLAVLLEYVNCLEKQAGVGFNASNDAKLDVLHTGTLTLHCNDTASSVLNGAH